jgi:nitrate reductase alpha subunit
VDSEESTTRREFIKIAAAIGASIAVVGFVEGLKSEFPPYRFLVPVINKRAEERYAGVISFDHYIRSTCAGNCTQACGWNAYVRGNTIVGLLQAADYDIHDPMYGGI